MTVYVAEEWSEEEADVLRRYFTNLDSPVFALVNLPEVVKGALFARYSRSPKSLRRLFLDEFVGDLDISGDQTVDATVGLRRAEELYDKVFFEYGDDSRRPARRRAPGLRAGVEPPHQGPRVGPARQLPRAVHPLHRLRLPHRRPLPVLPPARGARQPVRHPLRRRHGPALRHLRRARSTRWSSSSGRCSRRRPGDSDFVYRQAVRAKAFDALRGILPAASLSNLGIYATGQAYEALLLRMRSHPLPEARQYAGLMLTELRKVIPSFLKRVDLDDRGRGVEHLPGLDPGGDGGRRRPGCCPTMPSPTTAPEVRLLEWDPDGEVRMVTAMLYSYSHLPEHQIEQQVRGMTDRRADRGRRRLRR